MSAISFLSIWIWIIIIIVSIIVYKPSLTRHQSTSNFRTYTDRQVDACSFKFNSNIISWFSGNGISAHGLKIPKATSIFSLHQVIYRSLYITLSKDKTNNWSMVDFEMPLHIRVDIICFFTFISSISWVRIYFVVRYKIWD